MSVSPSNQPMEMASKACALAKVESSAIARLSRSKDLVLDDGAKAKSACLPDRYAAYASGFTFGVADARVGDTATDAENAPAGSRAACSAIGRRPGPRKED